MDRQRRGHAHRGRPRRDPDVDGRDRTCGRDRRVGGLDLGAQPLPREALAPRRATDLGRDLPLRLHDALLARSAVPVLAIVVELQRGVREPRLVGATAGRRERARAPVPRGTDLRQRALRRDGLRRHGGRQLVHAHARPPVPRHGARGGARRPPVPSSWKASSSCAWAATSSPVPTAR